MRGCYHQKSVVHRIRLPINNRKHRIICQSVCRQHVFASITSLARAIRHVTQPAGSEAHFVIIWQLIAIETTKIIATWKLMAWSSDTSICEVWPYGCWLDGKLMQQNAKCESNWLYKKNRTRNKNLFQPTLGEYRGREGVMHTHKVKESWFHRKNLHLCIYLNVHVTETISTETE